MISLDQWNSRTITTNELSLKWDQSQYSTTNCVLDFLENNGKVTNQSPCITLERNNSRTTYLQFTEKLISVQLQLNEMIVKKMNISEQFEIIGLNIGNWFDWIQFGIQLPRTPVLRACLFGAGRSQYRRHRSRKTWPKQ